MTLVVRRRDGALFLVATQLAFDAGWIDLVHLPAARARPLDDRRARRPTTCSRVVRAPAHHDTFSRFVPEAVVDQVLAAGRRAAARRRRRSRHGDVHRHPRLHDVLGGLTPHREVIDVLNRYLGEMSDAMLAPRRHARSFLGDGFMAVFGAPLAQAGPRRPRARRRARDLEVRLPRFNARAQRARASPASRWASA